MPDQSTGPQYERATHDHDGGGSARLFAWLRGLGMTRQNGWIGGVCGAVAARLGIDPIIVRGIAVVVAVLGGPALLLYAAAWLLLPDAHGDIHLERLIAGRFDPPIIAIIVIALFSFLPFAQGFWWAGAQFWTGLSWFSVVGRVLWTLVVIALIVGVIVWAARSGRMPPAPPAGPAPSGSPSASPAASSATDARADDGPSSVSHFGTVPTTVPAPGQDPVRGDGATSAPSDDLADWRARQEAWRADYAAWTARQNDARAIRQQRSAEIRSQAQALNAEADAARRRRRAANPRTGAAYVFIALGAAIATAGVAGTVALDGAGADHALAIALASATGVIGLAIATAGILRRRSGFLTFVSIVLLALTALAAVLPRDHALVPIASATYSSPNPLSIHQPVGSMQSHAVGSVLLEPVPAR